MKKVYVAADNIISALGFSTRDNMIQITKGEIGVRQLNDPHLLPVPICASVIDKKQFTDHFQQIGKAEPLTFFEQLLILSVDDAVKNSGVDIRNPRTLIIVSTTKGSIDVFENQSFEKDSLLLWKSAEVVRRYFGNPNIPVVISNACVSGVLAVNTASAMISSGGFDHVIVTGADLVTSFVASGFQSFMALSDEPCRPFDKDRKGLNLGEAAGTIVLTADKALCQNVNPVIIGHGSSANDATHISAPSRTAEGLVRVISSIFLKDNRFSKESVDYISAHGTATAYNDEMEAVALRRTGLSEIPVNSFKGYWGHTLGAAGILETIACVYSMNHGVLIRSAGFEQQGTTDPVNLITKNVNADVNICLKLASGFGGCNAGVILYRE